LSGAPSTLFTFLLLTTFEHNSFTALFVCTLGRSGALKAKREEQKVNDACDAIGRPMGSTWCWTLSNDDIAAGEVGTVVGFLHGQGKVQVKFSKVTWPFAPDQLITVVAWQKRIAVRFNSLF
jgi:hypothetical protein